MTYTHGELKRGLSLAEVREALRGRGWVSLAELIFLVGSSIPSAYCARYYRHWHRAHFSVALHEQIEKGRRRIVRQVALDCLRWGAPRVETKTDGKRGDLWFRLLEETAPDASPRHPLTAPPASRPARSSGSSRRRR